jgi:hypothetical protein
MQTFDCAYPARPDGECWNPQVYALVVLNSVGPDGWDYTIRLNSTSGEEANGGWNYFSDDVAGSVKTGSYSGGGGPNGGRENVDPLQVEMDLTSQQIYTSNGFMTLQLLLDRYIINQCYEPGNCETEPALPTLDAATKENDIAVFTGTSRSQFLGTLQNWARGELYLPQSVHAMPLPIQGYSVNEQYDSLTDTFALLYILILLPLLSGILTDLVVEKETKMRECLRIYGAGNLSMVGSWYLWYTLKFLCTAVLIALGSILQLFPNSDFFVLFFFYFFFLLSIMGFGFLASQLFDSSKTASVVGTLLWFVFYFMDDILVDADAVEKQAASVLAPIAFAQVGLPYTYLPHCILSFPVVPTSLLLSD